VAARNPKIDAMTVAARNKVQYRGTVSFFDDVADANDEESE